MININIVYICRMEKNKYLVISIPEVHEELLLTIKGEAKTRKQTVSQYVRDLLYKSLNGKENTAGLDDRRAAIFMEKSL